MGKMFTLVKFEKSKAGTKNIIKRQKLCEKKMWEEFIILCAMQPCVRVRVYNTKCQTTAWDKCVRSKVYFIRCGRSFARSLALALSMLAMEGERFCTISLFFFSVFFCCCWCCGYEHQHHCISFEKYPFRVGHSLYLSPSLFPSLAQRCLSPKRPKNINNSTATDNMANCMWTTFARVRK